MKPIRGRPTRRWALVWTLVVLMYGTLSLLSACGGSPDDVATPADRSSGRQDTGGEDFGRDDLDGDLGGADAGATGGSPDEGATSGQGEGFDEEGTDGGYNSGVGQNTVSGVVVDASGNPVEGVRITFYTVPRTGFYQTYTAIDGSYTYRLPDGVYQTFAFYGDPGTETDNFYPVGLGAGSSFTVPPSQEIDFGWGPQD
ncbi:carboxypeptidase-like regulatory domain-containing protein [Streptomyces sp. NPDC090106]|uniref:carboxypeptidase-like regulatory domain-containing protein n=1 Tax=Streptomyces sp. NPDC090106 TaxID=3365946 RepID=UPI00380F3271